MCFTPGISISTALIEFAIAVFLLVVYRKTVVVKFFVALLVFLGLYQFTEFMLCTTNNVQLWVRLGFLAYTFLPAIGLHFVLRYTKKNFNILMIYIPVIIFSLIALFTKNFSSLAICGKFFVSSKLSINPVVLVLYWLYYTVYAFVSAFILLRAAMIAKNALKRQVYLMIIMAEFLSIFPALILLVLFPSLRLIIFPSVYCQFAIIFAFIAPICVYLDNKIRK